MDGTLTGAKPRLRHDPGCGHFKWGNGGLSPGCNQALASTGRRDSGARLRWPWPFATVLGATCSGTGLPMSRRRSNAGVTSAQQAGIRLRAGLRRRSRSRIHRAATTASSPARRCQPSRLDSIEGNKLFALCRAHRRLNTARISWPPGLITSLVNPQFPKRSDSGGSADTDSVHR